MKIPTLAEVERDRRRQVSFWKTPPVAAKVVRGLKQAKAKDAEDLNKAKVRRRDKYCRFPLCACKRFSLRLEVSHSQHKGAGGNPKGDRSTPDKLIYLCSARHQENRIAVDRGTLKWKALTRRGSAGPVAWYVDMRAFDSGHSATPRWSEIARETGLHIYEPFTAGQAAILEQLAQMTM